MMKTAIPLVALLLCAVSLCAEEPGAKRAEALKANVKTFRLQLDYLGSEDKPFYRLALSVAPVEPTDAFHRRVQIGEEQALAIIDHLAESGFLDRARKTGEWKRQPIAGYLLNVQSGDLDLSAELGWNLAMLRQLDGLRSVLSDEAAKAIDLLLARLSGLRQQWENEADVTRSFDTSVGREDSAIRLVSEGDTTAVHVTSKFGIDKATIKRKDEQWPKSMVLRLHLTGLEMLKLGDGHDTVIELIVPRTRARGSTVQAFIRGGNVGALGKGFPLFTRAQIIGSQWQIPLQQGYFEVPLPVGLFKNNPAEITLDWVDFYRN